MNDEAYSQIIVLKSKHNPKLIQRLFVISTAIAVVQVSLTTFLKIHVYFDMITNLLTTSLIIFLLSKCNSVILRRAIRDFQVIYKMYNILLSSIGYCIIWNYFYNNYNVQSQVPTYIISAESIINHSLFMALISIVNDGYDISIKIKLLLQLIGIGYYSFMLAETVVSDSQKQMFVLSFTKTFYAPSWRSVIISSLFTLIVFIMKQMFFTIKNRNKFSIITCYVPIIIVEYNENTWDAVDSQNETQSLHHTVEMAVLKTDQMSPDRSRHCNSNRDRNLITNINIKGIAKTKKSDKYDNNYNYHDQDLAMEVENKKMQLHPDTIPESLTMSQHMADTPDYGATNVYTSSMRVSNANLSSSASKSIIIRDSANSYTNTNTNTTSNTKSTDTYISTTTEWQQMLVANENNGFGMRISVPGHSRSDKNSGHGLRVPLTIGKQETNEKNNNNNNNSNKNNNKENERNSAKFRGADTIEEQNLNHPIYIYKEYTIWFVLLNNICGLTDKKSYIYSTFIHRNKILQTICLMSFLAYFVYYLLFDNGEKYTYQFHIAELVLMISSMIAVVIIGLSINTDIFVWLLKSEFSIYWRTFDALRAMICKFIIMYIQSTWLFDGRFTTSEIVLVIGFEVVFIAIIGTFGISSSEGYLSLHKYTMYLAVLAAIAWWMHEAVYHCFEEKDTAQFETKISIFGKKYPITINFSDIVVVKSLDTSLWFTWQLWTMYFHSNTLRVSKIERKWQTVFS